MEKKIKFALLVLLLLSICFVGWLCYYFRSNTELEGVSCEADSELIYFNSLDNAVVPTSIVINIKVNYVFLTDNRGMLTITGYADSDKSRFFISRDFDFNYYAHDDFYTFKYVAERKSTRDTLSKDISSYFFNNDASFYTIKYIDEASLIFSNIHSPIFICNTKR